MNYKIILSLLALLIVAQSIKLKDFQDEDLASITHNNQQKFRYPRAEQSCSNPIDNLDLSIILISEVYGWYWDGQVCQPCAHPYCTCTKYRECDKCVDGYTKITGSIERGFGSGVTDSCQRCQDMHHDNYSYLSNWPWFNKKTGYFGLHRLQVDNCRVFLNNDMNNQWQKKRGDNWTEYNFQVWRRGFRAVQCGIDRPEDGIIFRHYGSVCWYMLGCQKYTKWGKCDTCMDGYYRDNDQVCQPCRATCVSAYDADYKYPCALTDNDASEGCAKCAEKNHCSVCKPGYWLASEAHYTRMHDSSIIKRNTAQDNTLLDDPSWCVPCPDGCTRCVTDSMQLTNDDPFSFFNILEAGPGHYKDSKSKNCPACDEGSKKIIGCKTCTVLLQEDTLKCTRCLEKVKDPDTDQDIFYFPNPIANACQRCPNHCSACEIIDNTPSCLVHACMNGFRFDYRETTENKVQYRVCVECKKDNASRCETDDNNREVITQCKTGATSNNKNYDDEVLLYREQPMPRMNFYPPMSEDYHLVLDTANKIYECRKNDNLCMSMKFDGTCITCYEDQGYYLDPSNKCTRCNQAGCLKCDQTNGKCATCKEGFFLLVNGSNNECRSCNISGCNKCTENAAKDDLKCVECKAGYKIQNESSDNPSCDKCNVQNCADCAAGIDTCTKCHDRFLLWDEAVKDESSGKESVERKNLVCETCDYGCIDCVVQNNRKFCNKCQDNMFLHSGACQEMQDDCIYWETNEAGSHKCFWCKHGYRLNDGRCHKCMSPDVGVIHCHTKCEGGDCWYSTINDFNLYPEEGEADAEPTQ